MVISCIDILERQQEADGNVSGGRVHVHTPPFQVIVTSTITAYWEVLQTVFTWLIGSIE